MVYRKVNGCVAENPRNGQNFFGTDIVYLSGECETQERLKEDPMKIQYRFAKLSKDQRNLLVMVLLEEMDNQRWFTVAFSKAFGQEIILPLQ